MAVCVPAEGYGDFAPPLACYGVPYPGQQENAAAPALQVVTVASVATSQCQWNEQPPEPVQQQYWQGDNGGDQSPQGGGNGNVSADWPLAQGPRGGNSFIMNFVGPANGSGWVPAPQRPNGATPNGGGAGQPARVKRRFCTSFPEVQMCRRGSTCAFAHSREEIQAPLLSVEEELQDPVAMTDDFFMFKYKTLWCPIGVQHEWHTCVYAHNYQDARRPVNIGYGARLCPYWSKKDTGAEYSQRCPLGLRCPYAHGAKEQLYHPQYFKTVVCRDLKGKACPRHGLCAFFHHRAERRHAAVSPDDVDYSQPLPEEALNNDWITEFLTPPFLPENKGLEDGVLQDGNGNMAMTSYAGPQAPNAPYGMQQPIVFLLPYPPPSPQQQQQQQPNTPQMGSPMNGPQMGSPMNGPQIGSPMQSPMNGPITNWVFVPVEPQQATQQA